MKKLILALAFVAIMFTSCTEQSRARQFGGDSTIRLAPGEKLVMATFKDNNVWYLVEPMPEGYIPQTRVLKESSSWGVLQGTVTFIETK